MTKLNNSLMDYQQNAVEKLKKLKVGALFMEQGTGKTITALELIRIRLDSGKINKVIWLCPCSAKDNIKRELVLQCPPEMLGIFVICGIETLSSSVKAKSYLTYIANSFDCFMVCDESLMIKNPMAKRSQSVVDIGSKCKYRLILNGTPISKNEADLFEQFYFLDWRILGYQTFWSFENNHIEYRGEYKIPYIINAEILTDRISPYMYKIKKSECLKLPPKHYNSRYFSLNKKEYEEYSRVSQILLDMVDEFDSTTVYRLFAGLQAVISGKELEFKKNNKNFRTKEMFEDPLDNPRIKALTKILTDEQTIIFCRYESEIEQICSLYPDDTARFDGKIPQKQRTKNLEEFRKGKKYLVANQACASYSLNLQFCHNIIYVSNDWDLGTRLQSEDRVHRFGQIHDVNITNIVADGTLDEQICRCLDKKESILDTVKGLLKNSSGTDTIKSNLQKYVGGCKAGKGAIYDCNDLKDTA